MPSLSVCEPVVNARVLRGLLWRECYRVAKLFEAMEVVTLNPPPILLVKVIRSQIGVESLRPQDMVDNH